MKNSNDFVEAENEGDSGENILHRLNEESKENNDSDKYRMWAAVSFAVMLLVVGVPLWWKTTQVERSPLPYNRISSLDPYRLIVSSDIYIFTEYPSLYNSLRSAFLNHFKSNPSIFKVGISSVKLDSLIGDNVTLELVESSADAGIIASESGSLLLVELPQSVLSHQILVSSQRIVYFSKSTDVEELVECVMSWMFDESEISYKMSSMLDPQSTVLENVTGSTRLRAATSYDFVFSVVISDPSRMNLSLDIKHLIKRYVDPLLNQLKDVGSHRARSQWIHLLDLNSWSSQRSDGMNVISIESLPHIITPLEKRIGSGVCGVAGCVQLVLYVVPCHSPPLVFGDDGSVSMMAPPWGSVQILNPDSEACSNGTTFVPKPAPIMSTFISQIHSLLGFSNPPVKLTSVKVSRKMGAELRDWQLDSLHRMRTVEQLVSASLTLNSLAKLLGEISNIVINTEVARCVEISVVRVEEGISALRNGRLMEALQHSQIAYVHAEKAFTDPSLLALLYFPDDQKYAVYIPLFLPIMIPVFMSLKPIYKWLIGSKTP